MPVKPDEASKQVRGMEIQSSGVVFEHAICASDCYTAMEIFLSHHSHGHWMSLYVCRRFR